MKFSVISLFPDLFSGFQSLGVVGQAYQRGQISLEIINPRQWTSDIHKTVDDRPFGGGDGMVMMAEPLSQALSHFESNHPGASVRRIYLSPQGSTLNHQKVIELAQEEHLLLLCGRYAGVDQRFLNKSGFEETSIGDYVLSGGELAALVLIDAVARQIPGVLGHEASSHDDSFAMDGLLEAPCFTRPRLWQGQDVPSFLLTGNHAQIAEDRWIIGVLTTFQKRRDLFNSYLNRQNESPKKWNRALKKVKSLSNNDLTSLGIDRKTLESLEDNLKHERIIC